MEVSPQAFEVPANAERRFARLIADYHLEISDDAKPAVKATSMSDRNDVADVAGGEEASQQLAPGRGSAGSPRWLIWTRVEPVQP